MILRLQNMIRRCTMSIHFCLNVWWICNHHSLYWIQSCSLWMIESLSCFTLINIICLICYTGNPYLVVCSNNDLYDLQRKKKKLSTYAIHQVSNGFFQVLKHCQYSMQIAGHQENEHFLKITNKQGFKKTHLRYYLYIYCTIFYKAAYLTNWPLIIRCYAFPFMELIPRCNDSRTNYIVAFLGRLTTLKAFSAITQ